MHEELTGPLGPLLVFGAFLVLVVKVIAAWNRFVSQEPGQPPGQSARPPSSRQQDVARAGVVGYRSRSGQSRYKFDIQWVANGYRIYILEHPSYGSRDTGAHPTHRLRDSRGSFVCWTGHLATIEQARKIAALWAEETEDYILRKRQF